MYGSSFWKSGGTRKQHGSTKWSQLAHHYFGRVVLKDRHSRIRLPKIRRTISARVILWCWYGMFHSNLVWYRYRTSYLGMNIIHIFSYEKLVRMTVSNGSRIYFSPRAINFSQHIVLTNLHQTGKRMCTMQSENDDSQDWEWDVNVSLFRRLLRRNEIF